MHKGVCGVYSVRTVRIPRRGTFEISPSCADNPSAAFLVTMYILVATIADTSYIFMVYILSVSPCTLFLLCSSVRRIFKMLFLSKNGAGANISIFLRALFLLHSFSFLFSACYALPTESISIFKKQITVGSIFPDTVVKLLRRSENREELSNAGVHLPINDAPIDLVHSISRPQKRASVTADYKMPGVLACADQLRLYEKMTDVNLNLPWVFYTGHPVGNKEAIAWAAKHFHENPDASQKDYKFIVWGRNFVNKCKLPREKVSFRIPFELANGVL